MLFPEPLRKGDSIALVAPSGFVAKEDLNFATSWLEKQGLNPVLSKNLFGKHNFGYSYSGTVDQRISDLQWAISSSKIKAIWCARGGYGMAHLLEQLDLSKMLENPKWVAGYSDITAFHQLLQKNNIASLHSITAKAIGKNQTKKSYSTLLKPLTTSEPIVYEWTHKSNKNSEEIEGVLMGGNLSILYSLMGTKFLSNSNKGILFLEDWQENWYALDRMLMNLILSGYILNFSAILLGSFTKMDDKKTNPDYKNSFDDMSYKIIQERLRPLKIPIFYGFPAGHINENLTLFLGAKTTIKSENQKVKLIQTYG